MSNALTTALTSILDASPDCRALRPNLSISSITEIATVAFNITHSVQLCEVICEEYNAPIYTLDVFESATPQRDTLRKSYQLRYLATGKMLVRECLELSWKDF